MYIGEIIKPSNGSLINDNVIIPLWLLIYYLPMILYTFSTCATLHIHHICLYYVRPISIVSYTYIPSILYSNIYLFLLGPALLYELFLSCIVSYTCYSSLYISPYVIIYWLFSYIINYFLVIMYCIRVSFHFIFQQLPLFITCFHILLYISSLYCFIYLIPFILYSLVIHYLLLSDMYNHINVTCSLRTAIMNESGGV